MAAAPDEVQEGGDLTATRPGYGPGVIDQPRHVHLQALEQLNVCHSS